MDYVDIKIEHVDMGETNNDKENGEIIQMDEAVPLGSDFETDYSDEDFDKDPDFKSEVPFESEPIFFM